uniref:G domain-containing protein n=1 Tax=Paulinella longichromatophora TaxID=1708747 RepID=A0A2H4ZNH3_9EUKA|nr:hypothetical protein PLO_084 [Paulinella longichromatophora]
MNNMKTWIPFSCFLILFTFCIQEVNGTIWYLQEILPGWVLILFILLSFCMLAWLSSNSQWKYLKFGIRQIINYSQRGHTKTPDEMRRMIVQSLIDIDRNLQQLKDVNQAKKLLQEKKRLEAECKRGDLAVVVFGTGSSGKTSLIRALVGKIVGTVNASMGSTDCCSKYRIDLNILERGLILIDTPGIFESGSQGRIREIKARWEASRADLVLLIIDGDLRSQEEEVINSLVSLGKRLILVLNKCDLWEEQEEEYLLSQLRFRCKHIVPPLDIVSASSVSQVPSFTSQKVMHLQPEVSTLMNRIVNTLIQDGEELIINNISIQCKYLYQASIWLLSQERQIDAQKIIEHYMWISTSTIVVSEIPGLELISMAAINTRMVMEIAHLYGIELDFNIAKALVVYIGRSLVTLGIIENGAIIIRSALQVNTPILLISKAVQIITLIWLTRLIGLSFITYFEQEQQWGNGGINTVLEHYYNLNKKDVLLKHFIEVAFNRVVEPLKTVLRK